MKPASAHTATLGSEHFGGKVSSGVFIMSGILFGLLLIICGAGIAKCGVRDGLLDGGWFEAEFGGLFLVIGIIVLVGTLTT